VSMTNGKDGSSGRTVSSYVGDSSTSDSVIACVALVNRLCICCR
jgi:hypothetical protein